MIFQIDEYAWNIQAQIERVASMTASDISGLLLDKTYFNDVLGTYMSYTVTMVVPIGMESDYAELYEILTNPVDGHRCVFPYNQETVEITGRIDTVSDSYYRKTSDATIWRRTSFTITANHPTKEITLEESITRGMTALPPESKYEIGTVIELTENGWQELNIENANDKEY